MNDTSLTPKQVEFLATADFQLAPESGWTKLATNYGYHHEAAGELKALGVLEGWRLDRVFLTEYGAHMRQEAIAAWIEARRAA